MGGKKKNIIDLQCLLERGGHSPTTLSLMYVRHCLYDTGHRQVL